jgi:bifunctional pyridoxal-dependent enzyme with beta-cystathionase and maltose regulon repressor activities
MMMAIRRARRGAKKKQHSPREPAVKGAALQPIGVVVRELTHPDGTKVTVKVPVYPPFRLADRPAAPEKAGKKKAS